LEYTTDAFETMAHIPVPNSAGTLQVKKQQEAGHMTTGHKPSPFPFCHCHPADAH